MNASQNKPLWTCPKCGAKFVTKNMWHSCGRWTVEKSLEGKGAKAKQFFNAFLELARKCGPYELAPAKTGVALMVRVRFAGVKAVSDRGMTSTFWLKQKISSPRFARVDLIPPDNWIYTFRVTSLEQLDDEVLGWLCLARQVGEQKGA